MKRAIVLSGGGAKGAYQIGVWKALRRMRIPYNIVTGTSVGALNAALMVQKDYMRALKLWKNISYDDIFNQKIDHDYETPTGKKAIIKTYTKGILTGGMDVRKLEETVESMLNIKKIYASKIDMGIVTVRLRNLKPVRLTKNQIKRELLKDYLVASASCYPAFKKKQIEDNFFIDGGLYDNLPINFAVELGATEIIAVDLREVGFKQKVKYPNIPITYISPRNDISSFLVFQKNIARRSIKFGYYDTLKTFGKLDGNIYTFKKGSLDKNYNKYKNVFFNTLTDIFKKTDSQNVIDDIMKISAFKRLISNTNEKYTKTVWNKRIENLGLIFLVEENKKYRIKRYNKFLINNFLNFDKDNSIENDIMSNKLKLLFNDKATIKHIYNLIGDIKKNKKKLMQLALIFPEEFLEALYLKTIINK